MPAASATRPIDTVQSVYLAYEMTFSQPTDCGVTGHLTDPVEPMRHKEGLRTLSISGLCRLASGMTAAYDDHIKIALFHVKHSLSKAE